MATRGRAAPFAVLFASLRAQTFRDFEVIVVDQNIDTRVGDLSLEGWPFPIQHLRTPTDKGLSRARNTGLAHAKGRIVLFPDDDCWYPSDFLAHAMERMEALDADVLAGRAADAMGRDINGRFERKTTRITRANVFTTGIEWVVFFKRTVIEAIGGYDTDIGVGAATPWQACEGQDVMLRMLATGVSCIFDPSIYGHHAELDVLDPSMLAKGRGYARGLGYVLRRHRYTTATAIAWVLRPTVQAALFLICGNVARFRYHRSIAIGRFEGWFVTCPSPPQQNAPVQPAHAR